MAIPIKDLSANTLVFNGEPRPFGDIKWISLMRRDDVTLKRIRLLLPKMIVNNVYTDTIVLELPEDSVVRRRFSEIEAFVAMLAADCDETMNAVMMSKIDDRNNGNSVLRLKHALGKTIIVDRSLRLQKGAAIECEVDVTGVWVHNNATFGLTAKVRTIDRANPVDDNQTTIDSAIFRNL
jgi:hypothetical protein